VTVAEGEFHDAAVPMAAAQLHRLWRAFTTWLHV